MPEATSSRLTELRARFTSNPGSRIYLQLAEEYRRQGEPGEAAAVLEQGLSHHPNDLSGLVALARCRLQLDEPESARDVLKPVIERDPTHIVANKLLLEAHLQRGDAAAAAERLGFYRLLNDRDPELDHLTYRLERLGGSDATEASESTETAERETETETDGDGDEAATDDAAGVSAAADDAPAGDEPGAEILAAMAPASTAAAQQPFGPLPSVDPAAFWRAVEAGGVFARATTLAPLGRNGEREAPAVEPKPAAEPEVAVGTPAVAEPEPAPQTSAEAARPETEDPASSPVPETVTMGELYLEQGYPQEAEAIFRRVLDRDPGDPGAREGLAKVAEVEAAVRRVGPEDAAVTDDTLPAPPAEEPAREPAADVPAGPVTAAALLAGVGALPDHAAARKALMLRRYLERLQRHVQ